MSTGNPNAVVGVGSDSAHWQARKTQSLLDRRAYGRTQYAEFYKEIERLQKEKNEPRWFYKEAPVVLSDKWVSQTSYRKFPQDRTKYVYSAKLPTRYSNTNYFQQW